MVPGGAGAIEGLALTDGLAPAAALVAGLAAAAEVFAAAEPAGAELAGAGAAPPQAASSKAAMTPIRVNKREFITVLLGDSTGACRIRLPLPLRRSQCSAHPGPSWFPPCS